MITIEELRLHLNLTTHDDDVLLAGKRAAAENWIEQFISTPLAEFDPPPPLWKPFAIREPGSLGMSMEEVSPAWPVSHCSSTKRGIS